MQSWSRSLKILGNETLELHRAARTIFKMATSLHFFAAPPQAKKALGRLFESSFQSFPGLRTQDLESPSQEIINTNSPLQGYLAHKQQPLPRTQQKARAQGPMVVLGGGVSYERGTLVPPKARRDVAGRSRRCPNERKFPAESPSPCIITC